MRIGSLGGTIDGRSFSFACVVASSAGKASQAVGDTDRANRIVGALSESTQRIGEIVQLISDIAAQTNLLALNATIEAARAGEQGRGFAVVASEVKTLATQTSNATNEIRTQIGEIQQATSDAVEAMRGVGSSIGELNEMSKAIASSTGSQQAATHDIARNVAQAADGTRVASESANRMREISQATGKAAQELLASAQGVTRDATTLTREIDTLLHSIRAA